MPPSEAIAPWGSIRCVLRFVRGPYRPKCAPHAPVLPPACRCRLGPGRDAARVHEGGLALDAACYRRFCPSRERIMPSSIMPDSPIPQSPIQCADAGRPEAAGVRAVPGFPGYRSTFSPSAGQHAPLRGPQKKRGGMVRARSVLLSFDVCLEDRVHSCKVSLSFGLEPPHNFTVETKMNGSLPSR